MKELEKMEKLLEWLKDVGRFGGILKRLGGHEQRDPNRRYIRLGSVQRPNQRLVVWVVELGSRNAPCMVDVLLQKGEFMTRGVQATAEELMTGGLSPYDIHEALNQMVKTKKGAGADIYDAAVSASTLFGELKFRQE